MPPAATTTAPPSREHMCRSETYIATRSPGCLPSGRAHPRAYVHLYDYDFAYVVSYKFHEPMYSP